MKLKRKKDESFLSKNMCLFEFKAFLDGFADLSCKNIVFFKKTTTEG